MFTAIISGYRFLYLQLAALVGYGWAIVALSFICSALMLPLMRAVAGIVRREKEYEDVIDPQVAAIKAKYESDMDRHFHIQALYQRYGYSPLAPIKKVMPLFVQIPFLLLTYYMLKGTTELSGVGFIFLSDLGTPDGLIPLSTSTSNLNLLPLVMTAVNILTVFATPGFSHKDWTQAIAISLLFLVLLYTAPSALLLYWTLNNTITFVRTLCEKRFSGAKLLMKRAATLRTLPSDVYHWMMVEHVVFVVFIVALLSLYCFSVAYPLSLIRLDDGAVNLTAGSRLMVMLLMLASLMMAIVLLRTRKMSVVVLPGVSTIVIGLYFCAWIGLRYVAPSLQAGFDAHFDRFVCYGILYVIWLLALLLVARGSYRRIAGEFNNVLKTDWPIVLLVIALGIHYAFSSENVRLPVALILRMCAIMVLPLLVGGFIFCVAFGRWISVKVVFRIIGACCVGIYVIPMISFETGVLGYTSNLLIRIVALLVLAMLFTLVRNRKILHLFFFFFCAAVVVDVGITIYNDGRNKSSTIADASLSKALGELHLVKTNSVYFLIYDGHVHRTVLDHFNVADDKLYDELKSAGFTIYDAYSKGAHTLQSMSGAFTVNGIAGGSMRSTMAGDNVYSDILKDNGYTTSYMMGGFTLPNRDERMPGDYYFPDLSKSIGPDGVLLACIFRGYLSQSASSFNDYTQEEWVEKKRQILGARKPFGNFLYAHSSLPGHAVMNPRFRKGDAAEIGLFKDRLDQAADEIRGDLKSLVDDEDAIVILAGDHGSMLITPEVDGVYNASHLLDRHGILLAIRWPKDYKPCMRLNCLQNVMLEVLIYLTGDTSLAKYRYDGRTDSCVIGSPEGSIVDGVIQTGQDKGKDLFSAAKEAFENAR